MNWAQHWEDIVAGFCTPVGVMITIGLPLVCFISAWFGESKIREDRKTPLAPLGIALLAYLGCLVSLVSINFLAFLSIRPYELEFVYRIIIIILGPCGGAMMGIRRGYRCDLVDAFGSTIYCAVAMFFGVFGLALLLPNY